ncbi:homoserine dehydrogenase [Clostridium pasteurianum DSM 525 = ATCC 6013]|uniref:Homoserine dehydrogenase n=1 Tax=Clostridium pasteurianum DSM 525 = ATCC 6013 TaxID=1262449 RepID=A0A0H3J0W1_CLOPA|nr:homoserine dehydrogenase [Clostridium pasteurianum]AJA47486.1 homoserine dehydrogenase [Clostridium pasteurianum DSM 525 = ATCC 6013]AJA51474.1 homoserine dehydrogenase [Clostridium pasteurianum DSM 525 = ATCC 6013]AOZ74805.1 homoserine dehydrogenase [Clostridium pasteurianum DSM 525 = ATCC 6013]AOZ78601.1 homoserine dehydrogenase [Clostridium pasteurianum]ELP57678.1 homoserine dehydrogenase [Clostridium pasteurianum DSM 525 = ATCC 6013]
MNKIKIALLGLGNVGKGVWEIFKNNTDEIIRRSASELEISKILVKDVNKDRGIDVPKEILTENIDDILNDDSIQIIVELMGGVDPASDYVVRAIKNKKHVVTANKQMIATQGKELLDLAKKEGVLLYYEGSVAGGIPILKGIEESLTANKIEEIVGIINGTTNYILTKMSLENMDFETALKEAQEKGYAEADPTSDIESYDAVYKLAILTSLSFGINVNVNDIYREGISKITSHDIQNAKEFGYTIKLLAIAKEKNDSLELRVHPTMIPLTHPLSNVNDSFNAILIKGNAVGDLMFYGRGAGSLPTGSAVAGDIISIVRNDMTLRSIALADNPDLQKRVLSREEFTSRYYLRLKVKDVSGVLGQISNILGKNDVSISSFIQKGQKDENNLVSIVFITHDTLEGNIMKSIEELKTLDVVDKIKNLIRVEKFI